MVVQATKTGPGVYAGTQVYRLTGPAFNAVPFPPIGSVGGPTGVIVGTASFTFSDGNNAMFSYTVDGVSQSKAITREVFVSPGTVCAERWPKCRRPLVGDHERQPDRSGHCSSTMAPTTLHIPTLA